MRLNKILSILFVSTVMVAASLPAQAQKLGIGISKFGKNTSISVGVSTRHFAGALTIRQPIRPLVPRGHFETRCVQVWIQGCGCEETIYVPPVYETFCDPCGNVSRVLVREGYTKVVVNNGHFETRCSQVWVPSRLIAY